VKEEADTLIQLGKTNPTLGFLGNQILVRMELAEATKYEREGKKAEKEVCLDRARKHFDEGQPYLNLGPAHDQTIVNSLFMARFYRLSGDLTGAAEHLKRAKDAVGDFALLNMDCELESAWLCLAEQDRVKASEYFKEVSNLVEQIGYHCIDREMEYLEKELGKA
jgi:hypothetical protein